MNPKELIKILEDKLSESPANHDVKEQLAFLLLAQGNLGKAETLFNDVVKNNPKASNSLWGLAKINWQKSSIDKAYSYMNLLSSIPGAKLNKEQALVFAKILAKKASFKEASRWLDVAIAQDTSLLQSELSFLKHIRQNLFQKQRVADEKALFGGNTGEGNAPTLKHSHYIVLEISQLLAASPLQGAGHPMMPPIPPQASEGIETPEHEKEDLEQVQKIVTLDQVGGLQKAKQSLIQDVILPLKNPQLCSMYGKSSNPVVLLYGPSGCGKTYLCKALASDSEVSFIPIKPSDFADLTLEEAELKLLHLLQYARDGKPAIILLDEFLWLSHSRNVHFEGTESFLYRSSLLNALLNAVSGAYSFNNQIGVVVTTNAPWHIDPSFLFSNKIGKHIFIKPPSNREKLEILDIILSSKQGPFLDPKKIDSKKVISSLPNISSGADIERLVDSAMSELLVETVSHAQKKPESTSKIVLTTDKLIKAGKSLQLFPSIKLWMNEAKSQLKLKKDLQSLWPELQQGLQRRLQNKFPLNLISRIKDKLFRRK